MNCNPLYAVQNKTIIKDTKSIKVKSRNATGYDNKQFDINQTKLPSAYKGNDIEGVFVKLKNMVKLKDEYETLAGYENRINSLYIKDTYAFKIENVSSSLESKYNAESSTLEITIEAPEVTNYDQMNYLVNNGLHGTLKIEAVIDTKLTHVSTDKYIGSNTYGAKTEVNDHFARQYGIGLANKDKFSAIDGHVKRHIISIELRSDIARSLKDNIGILLICKLRPAGDPIAFIFHSGSHSKPTLKNPTEVTIEQNYIFVNLQEIWVYDTRSGHVLIKDKIEEPQIIPTNTITNEVPVPKPAKTKHYKSPPYIWEDEKGAIQATDNMANVPENKRFMFEVEEQD